jgi:cytochrome c oxidase subunit II
MRALLVVLMVLTSVSVQAADAAAGKTAYAVCVACHGADGAGNQAMNSPRIAGQEDWYLKRQLEAFKEGIRGGAAGDVFGAQMRPMAMTLANPAAIDNVVAYVKTLTAKPSPMTVKGNAATGKSLYATCAACHGPAGQGMQPMNAPRLAGQSDWYLVRQLQNYKSGVRGSHPKDAFGMQMKPMAGMLANDQAINDVVAYIDTLK